VRRMAEHDDAEPIDALADADRQRVLAANQLARDRSMIAAGRRIGGVPGAIVAGAMIAIRDVYEGPKRDDGSVVVDSPSEPHDVDRDGVTLSTDDIGGDHDLAVPAQPRRQPVVARRASRRRR
jgi:hypothetical protein